VIGGLGEAVAAALMLAGFAPPSIRSVFRRVPRRRRAADTARPLRHLDGGDLQRRQKLAVKE